MTEEYRRFCVRCGANLPDEATFCPKCGSPVEGYGEESRCDQSSCGYGCCCTQSSCSSLDSTSTFTMLYGLLSLIMSAMFLVSAFSMTPELWNTMMDSMGEGGFEMFSMDQFVSLSTICGACGLVSSLCAIGCYLMVKKRKNFNIAIILCLVSSVASIGLFMEVGILTCIIGAFMTYRIYKNKNLFES